MNFTFGFLNGSKTAKNKDKEKQERFENFLFVEKFIR